MRGVTSRIVHAGGAMLLCLAAAMSIASIAPPRPVGASSDPSTFSAERAFAHLAVIAREPHPLGSRVHAEVREYLVGELAKLGLEVEVHEAQAAARVVGTVWSARVRNVIARMRGTRGGGPALMLAAHYDSVAQSRGASDDGFGVVVLLETARALRAGPPPANDILFVFTDGEELALRGAQAAVDDGRVLSDVALVLNFEARGTGGAVAMFETSEGSGTLIDVFASAVPYPTASSFVTKLAATLPNGTDTLVWKESKRAVLGFAFADGLAHYHRYTDDPDHIDLGSIQHGGSYALALARDFGGRDLTVLRAPDVVYFDLFGRWLVRTSTTFARVLAFATSLLVVVAMARGLRAKRFVGWSVAKGAGLAAAVPIFSAMAVAGADALVSRRVDFFMRLEWTKLFAWHALLLGGAVVIGLFSLALRKNDASSLGVGAMTLWAVGLVMAAIFAPELTPQLAWPLLFATLGLLAWKRYETPIALYLGSVPAVVMLANLVYAIFVAVGAMMPFAPAAFVALSSGLLIPVVAQARARPRWIAATLALAGSGIVAVAGHARAKYGERQPHTDSLVYTLDHDDGKTKWCRGWYADRWVRLRVPANAPYAPLPGFTRSNREVATAAAPRADLVPASVDVLSDVGVPDGRRVSLHIRSPRHARCLRIWDAGGAPIVFSPEIGGRPVRDFYRVSPEADEEGMRRMSGDDTYRVWRMIHCGLADGGLDLTLTSKGAGPIKLRVVEETEGLPEFDEARIAPRPRDLVPAEESDVTLVGKTFTL
jgi:hypothetical protein